MSQAKIIHSLFEHNYWARDKILDGVEAIDPTHLTEPSALSYGSISGLLTHMLNVEYLWRIRCQAGESTASGSTAGLKFEDPLLDIQALRDAWMVEQGLMMQYVSTLDETSLSKSIQYQGFSGNSFQNDLWEILMQFIYHGTQHRSELALKLTELGHSVGNLDLIIYLGREGNES